MCKVHDKAKHKHGVRAILLEVKGAQALVKTVNHGAPFGVELRWVRIMKSSIQ